MCFESCSPKCIKIIVCDRGSAPDTVKRTIERSPGPGIAGFGGRKKGGEKKRDWRREERNNKRRKGKKRQRKKRKRMEVKSDLPNENPDDYG